ncbi:MAG: DUF3179 domain-containing (seleno)protein [Candidatus Hodarchaeales archaeon]|jgi:hypothetical protein
MDISPFTYLAVIIAWGGFFFKTQFPFYWSTRPLLVSLKQYGFYFIILAWILVLIDFSNLINDLGFGLIILILIPSIGALFFRFFVFYGKYYPSLIPLRQISSEIDKISEQEPEIVLLKTSQGEIHLYPLAYLRINDVVFKSKNKKKTDYSLTYCVLCNTAHAYILPVIDGKQIEITSNNGTILNGNKILADNTGRYVWQQFTGEGLNITTKNNPLQELTIIRGLWDTVKSDYPSALVYKGKRPLISKIFFKQLSVVMKKSERLSFSRGKTDKRLKRKDLVIGIKLGGKSKAYPLNLFDDTKTNIIHDRINKNHIYIIHNKGITYIFKEEFLALNGEVITRDDKKWKLNGRAIGNHKNLRGIKFTDKAYWYMWSKFHPGTEIYNSLKIKL